MPTPADLVSFNRMRQSSGSITVVIPPLPELPGDVRQRFPSLNEWERKVAQREAQLQKVLRDLADQRESSQSQPAPIVGDDGNLYTMAVQVIAGVPTAVPVPL